jgi:hypothetical protein
MSSLKDKKSSRTEATFDLPAAAARPAEIVIGRVVGLGAQGEPIVDFPGNPAGAPVPALATARYDLAPPGAAVALMFLMGDPARPLALGVVAPQGDPHPAEAASEPDMPPECLTLTAGREIVLQCGRASITLTRAGKILLRGAYVSSRSSGMQRITGASVHIN